MRDLYVKKSLSGTGWVVWRGNPDSDEEYGILLASVERWFFTKRGAVDYAKRMLEARNERAEKITL
jgi:hypothetical protein